MKTVLRPQNANRRATVWRDERPVMPRLAIECAAASFRVRDVRLTTSREAAIEIVVLAGFPQYALVGGVFEARESDRLELRIDLTTDERAARFPSELMFTAEHTFCGIPREYLRGIMEGVELYVREAECPGGLLHVNVGAHDLVGSSINVFRRATQMLMRVIASDWDDEGLWLD